MKQCPDEGRLQSFYDGEPPADIMEQTARHIASCQTCSQSAREVESENEIYRRALEPEMTVAVPTEQLRARINAAVSELKPAFVQESKAPASWWPSLTELFRFTPQRATAFAGILAVILLGSIFATVKLKNGETKVNKAAVVAPPVTPQVTSSPYSSDEPLPPGEVAQAGTSRRNKVASRPQEREVKLIPGEESYLRTIAGLDVGFKDRQRSMSPTTRAEFERNLKLVDYAIAATRIKAKQSPHDPDAAGFMFAAYQSKIDLLSTMNETARLMPGYRD